MSSSPVVRSLIVLVLALVIPAALPARSFGDPRNGRVAPADGAGAARSPIVPRTPPDAGRLRVAEDAVRTHEPGVAEVLAVAATTSATFQDLIDRLRASDVIVYVRTSHELPQSMDGQLTFMAASGGRRYVLVTLAWGNAEPRLIATLAHELQHAVEIAERTDIVDTPSLGQAYESFGDETSRGASTTYETRRAVETAARVLVEVTQGRGTR